MSAPEEFKTARNFNVLVVDDEPCICRLIQLILQREGCSVKCASDGSEASQALAAQKIDVLLTDVLLGDGQDGIELLQWAKRLYPQMRTIVMSGGGSVLDSNYCLRLANTFRPSATLRKPFTREELISTLALATTEP